MSRPTRDREQEDDEISRVWSRGAEWDEVTAVGAIRLSGEKEWPWQVIIPVAEYIREEPLESELAAAVAQALRRVRWVRDAVQEDREVWVVSGHPRGKSLVVAVAKVLDRLEPQLRQHVDSLAG